MEIKTKNQFILPEISKEVLDELPFGVYVINKDGKLEYVNKEMVKISGVKGEKDLEGQNILKIPTYKKYGLIEYIKRGLLGKPFKIEGIKYVSHVGKKESIRSYFGIPIKDSFGKVDKLLCIIEDVSAEKNLQAQIKERLKERDVLLKEINHRVKNNMQIIYSILNLQSLKIKDKNALNLLEESKGQIKSMLLVHERLYNFNDLSKIDFGEYIDELVEGLFNLYLIDKTRITKKIETENIYLNINKAIPCALIINELVSNSFKYAFPDNRKGEVAVSIKMKEDNYELIISDDGVGISKKNNLEIINSLGFELVDSLIKQIYGHMEVGGAPGTKYIIKFPINV